jgi:hypothetical protein
MVDIDSYNDIVFDGSDVVIVDGEDALRQRVKRRLLTFWGEWFLNRKKGVDYFGKVLGVQPQPLIVYAEFRRVILDDDEVTGIHSLNIDLDNGVMTVDAEINTAYGLITIAEEVQGG